MVPIVINEVLYDPAGADAGLEYVELAAAAGADTTASLAGWVLETANGSAPGEWTVEWVGSPADRLHAGRFLIGESSVEPTPHAVADLDLQNGPDACRVRSPSGEVDRLGWGEPLDPTLREGASARDVTGGVALARLPDGVDTDSNASDFAPAEPTPGEPNAPEFALAVESLRVDPSDLPAGHSVTFTWTVHNVGRAPFGGRVALRCDVHPGEVLADVPIDPPLLPGSRATRSVVVAPPPGVHRPRSDPPFGPVGVWVGSLGELGLSEAMSRPRAGEPEWIEIVSNATAVMALDAFAIEDAAGTHAPLSGLLSPRGRVLVASDARQARRVWEVPALVEVLEGAPWPALNQSASAGVVAERVRLLLDDVEIDAAALPGGASEGESWERITMARSGDDPANWAPSLDPQGGTPGRPNSRFGDRAAPAGAVGSLAIAPAPFRPDRDPTALVVLRLPRAAPTCEMDVYDAEGRWVVRLAPWTVGGLEHRALWDGRDGEGRPAALGLYLVAATCPGLRTVREPLVVVR